MLKRVQNLLTHSPKKGTTFPIMHHTLVLPGEKMSGLKRMSKEVLLMDPTALQALRTTSLLLGSGEGVEGWSNRM